MESKLNELALETYSTAFTDRVSNDFFARHERINGEHILQLTPVHQVNLFIIKNLFEVWQQEALRLRSPYFDYNSPKVKEALKVYMNTLSRHILVDEDDLKPLLKKAVKDTLILTFAPISHLCMALESTEGRPQNVNEVLRYIKIHQIYAKEAKSILNRQEVTDPKWISHLKQALEEEENANKIKQDPIQVYLQQFSQVLPLKPSEIIKDHELEKTAEAADDDIDFFSSITGSFEDEEPEPRRTGNSYESGSFSASEVDLPKPDDLAPRHAQIKRADLEIEKETTAPRINITTAPSSTPKEYRPSVPLNERLKDNGANQPLNHKLNSPSDKPSLANVHARKKNGSIRTAINLNQRFMFTKELFKGDSQAFNQALDKLDSFNTYDEASHYTARNYARQYNWDEESEESQEFYHILQSRFQ